MKLVTALLVTGTMALVAPPAVALPPQAGEKAAQDQEHMPAQAQEHQPATPAPRATAEAKRKATARTVGTRARRRPKARTRATSRSASPRWPRPPATRASPREACESMSKKHTKGEKGTPFSRCRVGVAQLREDDEDSSS